MNKGKINHAKRFAAILGIAILINMAFYRLPDSIFDIPVKKVDLLSDIRITSSNDENLFAEIPDSEFSGTDNINLKGAIGEGTESQAISKGASIGETASQADTKTPDANSGETANPANSKTSGANGGDTNSSPRNESRNNTNYLTNKNIEDFTPGHNGLHRFFSALDNIDRLGRPVRIAFLGDSFIEGDILVADFRAKMQEQFGGRGVGFVPVTSITAQYRPTVKQSATGWKSYSILKDKNRKYVLSGFLFEPASNDASLQFQTVDSYPGLEEVSSLKFIYDRNVAAEMIFKNDNETLSYKLPPTEVVTQFELKGRFRKGTLQFKNSKGLRALGIALEDNHGVVVDNFSIRGNSGASLSVLDSNSCRDLQQIRPYDLIVLQYGLNVASESVREYSWYRNKMVSVIEHIHECFPDADILVLGVSDRSRNGRSTMPAVLSLLRAQRQMAERTEVAFWSIFAAMGGQNSMVKYVNSNWASKDYTHLRFRGGREIAYALYDALITEKILYDEQLVEK